MIRKLIFIPLILVFISCTVTKRVHRPGYHVQWKKIERTQKSEKLDSKLPRSKAEKSENELTLELAKIDHFENEKIERTIVTALTNDDFASAESDEISINDDQQEESNIHLQQETFETNRTSIAQGAAPIFWRTPAENLRKLGIALMLIGGMLLFASLLVYLGAFSGDGGGAWLNFFLDLIDISGWFWVFFFIVIFILISYLLFLFVLHVLGGPLGGLILGLVFLGLGLFFYILGERRTVEPPN